jgi:MYXO-CTERM domain-containing protein
MLLLTLPALALDFLQGDAGAPGMAVNVSILRDVGGFTGGEVVTTSCGDIVVGPSFALDRAANPAAPVTGSVLSTVFFVDPGAPVGDCVVSVDGVALGAFNAGVDNQFSVVTPRPAPVDGGVDDADGAVDGVITLAASARSDGGVLVVEELAVAASETLRFDTSDPIAGSPGNEAFLPVIALVEGAAVIEGTVELSGYDGEYSYLYPSDGGDGGAGGGGGGVGSNCVYAPTAIPGDGFTGGGGASTGICIEYTAGGTGAGEGPDGEDGGEGVFTTIANGAIGYAGGTGGGTGMAWGTGGGGGMCCGTAGAGGYGGGGGTGHSEASGWGGGGGGFGTSGENGVGTVGGGVISYTVGGAGLANGSATLVPLAGGSGGAGGDSGSGVGDGGGGGGGGGALLISADTLAIGAGAWFDLAGGDGGDTYGRNPGSSTGGSGGSGGGLHLAARSVVGLSASVLDLSGGLGGVEGSGIYVSGDGGEGRLRVDGGAPPMTTAGPTGAVAPTWQGPAITAVSGADVTISGDADITLYALDATGTYAGTSTGVSGDTVDLSVYIPAGTQGYVVVFDTNEGVLGPVSASWIDNDLDGDGDGFVYSTDCDDGDAAVNPDAVELCNGLDDDCDGDVDTGAADASTWYADTDGDGFGDSASTTLSCDEPAGYVASSTDCNDADAAVSPDAAELCNGVDDDCDGATDEDASDASAWYTDSDGDGYGAGDPTLACEPGADQVADSTDCDDADGTNFPGGVEVCDGLDDDCDGVADEDASDASAWYTDSDGDGFGDDGTLTLACDAPDGTVATAGDCDDADAAYNPGAAEDDCTDPNDYNCDGSTGYADLDGDTFAACAECDDGVAAVNPDATEVCNGVDDDCDGTVDVGAADAATYYADTDGDGYGDATAPLTECGEPEGYVADATDCDDGDPALNVDCDAVDDTGVAADTGKAQGGGGCGCDTTGPGASFAALLGVAALVRRRRNGVSTAG